MSKRYRSGLTLLAVTLLLGTGEVLAEEVAVNPLANSRAAAEDGKFFYLQNCQQCHDADGKAQANIDFVAANLTAPDTWFYGKEPINIFNNIKNGAGLTMPPFRDRLNDDEIWKIVAHIRNIGPEETRPTEE